ncbi:M48 family metallopeptidase [Ponticoccus sp. SC2-23]|uniref:M48 family metallopeptidase n=1 Tax=Alexandriicola marinus TaxID=2081710 RepID=UPI000FDBDC33|nr:M48 family metallopeptidase [Alexandriicola marinus]MBM1222004.1 M48 family metallopeptidase [Ponticoccus sp. SC6-9]MBM1226355.1 M48 family metallopeptidase [Ponticoccus sp. SC6-15]MBM1230951.1 M48 family metallopeptidase [Ponticoccus sp. SC6-38]MBM1235208.1 M48 family metallopeptidase [Ponticoccus sp. SC6-45]MBM1239973.1 M48 family metallopeptidase [Ponticoccus sp. SC6-49]MBM1244117.1 M48 family metallopeptidase [Ponticoccus sp. SC2-64]MBM1248732.1 M48 family metallopeptidase [Ponticoccu
MTARTVIAIGARPPVYEGRAIYFDGAHPVPAEVTLRFDDEKAELLIEGAGDAIIRWPYLSLRAQRDQAKPDDGLILSLADGDPARLMLDARDTLLIRARAHRLHRRVYPVRWRRIALLGLSALASVALMIAVLVPVLSDRLAEALPPEGEAALGEATLGHIRRALDPGGMGIGLCDDPEGLTALALIEARLSDALPEPVPFAVSVADHEMVNAFALPGGQIVLFRGLIEEAGSAEEVAAVLAHEIGHVAARDPTRIALRSAGSIGVLGLLFGDFAGGAIVLFLAERIMTADYTQEAEAQADAYAHNVLVSAGVSPAAIADFFDRLMSQSGDPPPLVQHFLAHPAMSDRIAAARSAVPDDFRPDPLLSGEEWAALQGMCQGGGETGSGA